MATGSPGAMFTDATTIAASDVPLNTDEGVKIFLIYRDMSMASCAAIRPTRSTAAISSVHPRRSISSLARLCRIPSVKPITPRLAILTDSPVPSISTSTVQQQRLFAPNLIPLPHAMRLSSDLN